MKTKLEKKKCHYYKQNKHQKIWKKSVYYLSLYRYKTCSGGGKCNWEGQSRHFFLEIFSVAYCQNLSTFLVFKP